MPGLDGTGPDGRGPMTGRGEGYCALVREQQDGTEMVEGYAGVAGRPVEIRLGAAGRETYIMPLGDGTGPAGMGPMTGRAAGYCSGYGIPGYMNPVGGRRGFYRGVPYPTPGAGRLAPAYRGALPYRAGFGRGPGFGRGLGFGRGPGFGRGLGFGPGLGFGVGRGFASAASRRGASGRRW
jgi:hypothetical protein